MMTVFSTLLRSPNDDDFTKNVRNIQSAYELNISPELDIETFLDKTDHKYMKEYSLNKREKENGVTEGAGFCISKSEDTGLPQL